MARTTMADAGPSGYDYPKPIDGLDNIHRHILRLLNSTDDAPLRLGDIHSLLVEIEGTRYNYSPKWGNGWNAERADLQNVMYSLHNTDLVVSPENSDGWAITRVGSLLAEEIERAGVSA